MRAVIMAGGKGTRVRSLTNDEIPKPMLPVCGKPILEHQLNCLKRNGIHDITMIVGHLGEKIIDYFGDGSAFQVQITYIQEKTPLGTAGALYYLKETCQEDFLLVYGDIIFDVDVGRFAAFHQARQAEVTVLAHPNAHPFDSDLILHDAENRITGIDRKSNVRDYYYDNCVNSGITMIAPSLLDRLTEPAKTDFEKDLLLPLCGVGAAYAYCSPEYVKDVGTPDRIAEAEADLCSGLVAERSLSVQQKCIFLDRDGTVNRLNGLIYKPKQLELEDCAAKAVRAINASGYLAILITNQPAVAKGLCQETDIVEINNKLKTLLGAEGCYLNDVFYCPHHPEKGFPDENPAYKIVCDCRKPDIGLVTKAQSLYHIDLSRSWFVGDSTSDIQTGINAGCKTALVQTGEAGKDGKYAAVPDVTATNLYGAVQEIIRGDGQCNPIQKESTET